MQDWTAEIIEQICIGEIIFESKAETANRLALIVIDNGVDFALRFYCSHNRLLSQSEVNAGDAFFKALDKVSGTKITPGEVLDIGQFHNHRNVLYHGAKLTTVNDRLVSNYLDLSKKLLSILYNYSPTDSAWKAQIAKVRKSLSDQQKLMEAISFETRTIEGHNLICMKWYCKLKTLEEILLVIYGYNTMYAKPPSDEELLMSLKISTINIPERNLAVYVHRLRKTSRLETRVLSPTNSAVISLKKKFAI